MLPERHPACRWREAQPDSCTERENLAGDAKGKGASGSHREVESTNAPESLTFNPELENSQTRLEHSATMASTLAVALYLAVAVWRGPL
jgi:hypothetical protein